MIRKDIPRPQRWRDSPRLDKRKRHLHHERKTLKRRVEKVMFTDRVTPLRCSIIKQLSRLLRSNRDVNQGSHPSFIALGIRARYGS